MADDFLYNNDYDLSANDEEIFDNNETSDENDESTYNTVTPPTPSSPPDPVFPTVSTLPVVPNNPTAPSYEDVNSRLVDGWLIDTTKDIGSSGESIPYIDPVEEDVVEPVIFVRVIRKQAFIINNYDEDYLLDLYKQGYSFYVRYTDNTEELVEYTEIFNPLAAITDEIILEGEAIAKALDQHIWNDTSGIHVSDVDKDDWIEAVSDDFSNSSNQEYHNILINSLGILLRTKLNNLTSVSKSGMVFYDGEGNNTSNIKALFGNSSIQLGKNNSNHMILNSSGLYLLNEFSASLGDSLAHFGEITSIGSYSDVHLEMSNDTFGIYKDDYSAFRLITESKVLSNRKTMVQYLKRSDCYLDTTHANDSESPYVDMMVSRIYFDKPCSDINRINITARGNPTSFYSYYYTPEITYATSEYVDFTPIIYRRYSGNDTSGTYETYNSLYVSYLADVTDRVISSTISIPNGVFKTGNIDILDAEKNKIQWITQYEACLGRYATIDDDIDIIIDQPFYSNFSYKIVYFTDYTDMSIEDLDYYLQYSSRYSIYIYRDGFDNNNKLHKDADILITNDVTYRRFTSDTHAISFNDELINLDDYPGIIYTYDISLNNQVTKISIVIKFGTQVVDKPLLKIGNGLSSSQRDDAVIIFSNGSSRFRNNIVIRTPIDTTRSLGFDDYYGFRILDSNTTYPDSSSYPIVASIEATQSWKRLDDIPFADCLITRMCLSKENIYFYNFFNNNKFTCEASRELKKAIIDEFELATIGDTHNRIEAYDMSQSNNGVSSVSYTGLTITDKNGDIMSRFLTSIYPNGKIGTGMWVYNSNNPGYSVGNVCGLEVTLDKSGNVGYYVHSPTAFANAIGVLTTSGGQFTGNISVHTSSPMFRLYDSDVNIANANNNISSKQYQQISFCDKYGREFAGFEGIADPDGSKSAYMYVANYNASSVGIKITIDHGTTYPTYSVSTPANFRSAIGAAASSDRRLKSEIKDIDENDAVDFILKSKPSVYTINGEHQVGLIAQDVYENDIWNTRMAFETQEGLDGLDDWEKMEDGSPTWKLDYIRLLPPTIKALQNALNRIDQLEGQILELEKFAKSILRKE